MPSGSDPTPMSSPSTSISEVTAAMIERWLEEHSKELARVPYISPDKIKMDTQTYGLTLRYYGERFLSEFLRRPSGPKIGKDETQHTKL